MLMLVVVVYLRKVLEMDTNYVRVFDSILITEMAVDSISMIVLGIKLTH